MDTNDFFGEGGLLSEELQGFIPREGQIELAEAVKRAIENKRHLIAEAGTGTGKSMGYGIPAAVWATETGKTAVIATANITLQEQLFSKDLPTIKKIISRCLPDGANVVEYFEYILVKGMSNYLCLLGLEESAEENEEEKWYQDIHRWSKVTETGDKSELAVEYPGMVWAKVASNSDECLKKECKFYEKCFVFRARRGMNNASIIVTNYHMLFTDMLVRNLTDGRAALLPDYEVLIMDEAHEVASIAMDFQGFQLTPNKLNWAARSLSRISGSDKAKRILKQVQDSVDRFTGILYEEFKRGKIIERPIGRDGGVCSALRSAAAFMDDFAENNIDATVSDKAKQLKARLEASSRLCRRRAREVEEVCFGVLPKEQVKAEIAEKVAEQMPLFPDEHKKELDALRLELAAPPSFPKGYVYFFEQEEGKMIQLCAKVVTPQEFLRTNFFSKKTCIMTSATISTGDDFDFLADQIGLESSEYDGLIVSSPFDPEMVMSVVPPETFPTPDSSSFLPEATKWIAKVRNTVEGGVMALFTSHRNLSAVASGIGKHLEGSPMIYVQGTMPKARIIESFKRDHEEKRPALILATASFWQGVDIPGQALSVVIIDKIPFAPPDDPIMHYLDRIGENAFHDYSMQRAIIALKQGVGRLIRRETDFGCVIILDTRLRTKNYRRAILSALPEGRWESDNVDHVASFISDRS